MCSSDLAVHLVHVPDLEGAVPDPNKDFVMDAKPSGEVLYRHATGALDHIAFSVSSEGFQGTMDRLDKAGIAYRVGRDLAPRMIQIWAFDPSGIKVELNFS